MRGRLFSGYVSHACRKRRGSFSGRESQQVFKRLILELMLYIQAFSAPDITIPIISAIYLYMYIIIIFISRNLTIFRRKTWRKGWSLFLNSRSSNYMVNWIAMMLFCEIIIPTTFFRTWLSLSLFVIYHVVLRARAIVTYLLW